MRRSLARVDVVARTFGLDAPFPSRVIGNSDYRTPRHPDARYLTLPSVPLSRPDGSVHRCKVVVRGSGFVAPFERVWRRGAHDLR